MKITFRMKVFACMVLLMLIVSITFSLTTQLYAGELVDQFRKERIDANYLKAMPEDQIEIFISYFIDNMKLGTLLNVTHGVRLLFLLPSGYSSAFGYQGC